MAVPSDEYNYVEGLKLQIIWEQNLPKTVNFTIVSTTSMIRNHHYQVCNFTIDWNILHQIIAAVCLLYTSMLF